jgi:hypothetical protein
VKSRIALAKGTPGLWEKTFLGVTVSALNVSDSDAWYLIVPEEHQPEATAEGVPPAPTGPEGAPTSEPAANDPETPSAPDAVGSITVQGDVTPQQYTQLFQSFLMPMAHKQLNPQVTVRIEATVGGGATLSKNDPAVKAMIEAARQLGVSITID